MALTTSESRSPTCWIVGATDLKLLRARTVASQPTPKLFRVTDASYGQTFTIHRCQGCGSRVTSYLPGGNTLAVPKMLGRIEVPMNFERSLD